MIKVNDVIEYLKEAREKTYSTKEKMYLSETIEVLFNLKDMKILS